MVRLWLWRASLGIRSAGWITLGFPMSASGELVARTQAAHAAGFNWLTPGMTH
jgi:hypothetical protein